MASAQDYVVNRSINAVRTQRTKFKLVFWKDRVLHRMAPGINEAGAFEGGARPSRRTVTRLDQILKLRRKLACPCHILAQCNVELSEQYAHRRYGVGPVSNLEWIEVDQGNPPIRTVAMPTRTHPCLFISI